MAKPQVYKTDNPYGDPTSPLIFERGRLYPHPDSTKINQIRAESGAGYPTVVTNGMPRNYKRLSFGRLTQTQINNLMGFFEDSTVNYSAHTFTFKDEAGTAWTVRLWTDSVDRPFKKPTTDQDFDVLVRVEETN